MAKTKITKNGAVEKKLVGLADMVIASAQREKDPTMEIPLRALSNVTFNPRKGLLEMGGRNRHVRSSTSAWPRSLCRPYWSRMPSPSCSVPN